ncbi:MAG: radical SAM family heme chaperone HemW [Candidatus Omnitrophota bacterium]
MNSLYVHIPFCQSKCLFCSFVIAVGQTHKMDAYLDALSKEADFYKGENLKTVYIGGGTPSLLSADGLKKLFSIIKQKFVLSADCEVTLEANPESLDVEKAKLLYDLGVNRVSLGVQSLEEKYLKFLGRNHGRDCALGAFRILRKTGFQNISLDLMFSFPQQTSFEIEGDVRAMASLNSEHISLYALTVEEKSKFFSRRVQLSDDTLRAEQYSLVIQFLNDLGFPQYEVSNFSKPKKESRHNLAYWQGENYIGLGVGAHSHKDGTRSWNTSNLSDYLSKTNQNVSPVEGEERLDPAQRFMETLLFGLRMNRGVDVPALEKRFSCALPEGQVEAVNQFLRDGFLTQENNILKVTDCGRLILDELCSRLI